LFVSMQCAACQHRIVGNMTYKIWSKPVYLYSTYMQSLCYKAAKFWNSMPDRLKCDIF